MMKLSINSNKRLMIISLLIVLSVLLSAVLHNAFAAKKSISLNSPVSFPVDI